MPTYEYICDACAHEFEQFQSITARALRKCPACAKPRLRRKIGIGAGVIFKGSGFYETDYRSSSYKAAAKAEASGTMSSAEPSKSAGNGSSPAAKAAAKPTAATETKSASGSAPKPAAKS